MSHHEKAMPIDKPFFSSGVKILVTLAFIGICTALYRIFFSLEAVTNLTNQYPWGLWIGVDVASGVALAAGGFTTGVIVYVFHKEHFHAVIRPALLTALLGYTFVVIGLAFDLGKWYNIWHPMLPSMWQGNSVLFEVGMCVMIYLTVLYIEFVPIVTERFIGRVNIRVPEKYRFINHLINIDKIIEKINARIDINKTIEKILIAIDRTLEKYMIFFLILGITLSCLHQSSLGTLMVIAPYKMHPLYWSELSPLFFLASAIAVGYPMVVVESMIATKSFGRKPEMHVLTPLAKFSPYLLGIYILIKIFDMAYRESYVFLFDGSPQSLMFWFEFGILTIVPFLMLMSKQVRESAGLLFTAAFMYVMGVLLNRVAVFIVAYEPPYAEQAYIPAIGEFAVTIGLIATLMLVYRAIVTVFPVIPAHGETGHEDAGHKDSTHDETGHGKAEDNEVEEKGN